MKQWYGFGMVSLLALAAAFWLPAHASAQVAKQTVAISEKEYSLTPNKVEVKMGSPVEFSITNNGTIEHNFQLELPSQNIEQKLFDVNLKPGETKTASFSFNAQGDWEMYCPIDGHEDLGMKGTITVSGAIGGPNPNAGGSNPPPTTPTTGGEFPSSDLIAVAMVGLALLTGGLFLRQLFTTRQE
jgi:uncharacterized cupredoxin-like copper-binding protein